MPPYIFRIIILPQFLLQFRIKSVGVHCLPFPQRRAHIVKVAGGFPAQLFFGFVGAGVAGGNIARAARCDDVRNFVTAGLFKRMNYVQHAITYSRAEIVDINAGFFALFDGLYMSYRKVDDVNIVAHARAVRTRSLFRVFRKQPARYTA